jgi:hypothetical protein
MTELLARFSALFVEPAAPARAVPRPPPPSVGLVAERRGGLATASLLALGLARIAKAPGALVCAWPPELVVDAVVAPASPGARRLARTLRVRDLAAVATGRLVRLALPLGPDEAAATHSHAIAASDLPAVALLAGPRPPALEALLGGLDALLVAPSRDGDPRLADLALAGLAEHGRPTGHCRLRPAPLTAALATAGAAPAPSRRVLAPMLEAVS